MDLQTIERQIGNWVLEKELGTGAMGIVYLASHKTIGSQAAIKAMLPLYAGNTEVRERFIQEARAQINLRHNNIAGVFDFIEHENQNYIVMEYLSGGSLQDYLYKMQGPVPISQALNWTKQLLSALEYGHEQGVIHRDIKPSNLMLGENDQIKVSDFGIALVVHGKRMTITGASVGTAEYMSPEQVINSVNTDHRSDIYSLGVVLFEMLTGSVPFIRDNEFEARLAHVQETPPSIRDLNPSVPPEIEQIVMRALIKDPDGRYADCSEFASRIIEFEQNEQSQPALEHMDEVPQSRNRWPEPEKQYQMNGHDNASALNRPSGRFNKAAINQLTPGKGMFNLPVFSRSGITIIALLLAFIAASVGFLTAGRESRMDRYYTGRSLLEKEGTWPQVETKYREMIMRDPKDWLSYGMLIESLFKQNKYKEAEAAAREAISIEPDEGLWHDLLGDALKSQGKKTEAEVAYQQSMRLAKNAADRHVFQGDLWSLQENWPAAETDYREAVKLTPDRPLLHAILGQIMVRQKKWAEAENELREAIRQMPGSSEWLSSLGWLFFEQEKWSDAETAYREAIRISPSQPDHHAALGNTLARMKRHTEAESAFSKAMQLAPDDARFHSLLGDFYFGQSNWLRAETSYREALRLRSDNAVYMADLGWVLANQNKFKEAEAEFSRAIAADPDNADYRGGRGLSLVKLKRHKDAVAELREAVRLKPDSSYLHNELGVALGWLRNFREAAAEFREAMRLDPDNNVAKGNYRKVT